MNVTYIYELPVIYFQTNIYVCITIRTCGCYVRLCLVTQAFHVVAPDIDDVYV